MASDSLVPSTCLPEAVGRAGAVGWHQRVDRDEGVVSARCYRRRWEGRHGAGQRNMYAIFVS